MTVERPRYLSKMYQYDHVKKAYIIEVALDFYKDMFSEWDPAPFRRRDLDHDFMAYLEDCSADIPVRYPIQIRLYLPREEKDKNKEYRCIQGLNNYFELNMHLLQRDVKKTYKQALFCFLAGIGFLTCAFLAQLVVTEKNVLLNILPEGLFIGGWVMFWEVFSLLFFTNSDTRNKLMEFRRFNRSDILFRYNDTAAS